MEIEKDGVQTDTGVPGIIKGIPDTPEDVMRAIVGAAAIQEYHDEEKAGNPSSMGTQIAY